MNDETRLFLSHLVPLLGHTCRNKNILSDEADKDAEKSKRTSVANLFQRGGNDASFNTSSTEEELCEQFSYPSFSLSRPKQGDGSAPCSSTGDMQVKASAWMSQPIVLDRPGVEDLEQIPCHILQNILDCFDQLVDTRIQQYSKVLRNHFLGLSSATNNASGARKVVEYKLRKLLEFGTNISFCSISTRFSIEASEEPSTAATTTTTMEQDDNGTTQVISLPILLTVEIQSLHVHTPSSGRRETSAVTACFSNRQKNKVVTLRARGKVLGILRSSSSVFPEGSTPTPVPFGTASCCHNAASCSSTSGGHMTGNARPLFNEVSVQIDCEELLKEMMEEAEDVVGMVVELCNEAWARNQAKDEAAVASVGDEPSDLTLEDSIRPVAPSEVAAAVASHNDDAVVAAHHSKQSNSPKLGAKTVSELSFEPGKLGARDCDGQEDDHKPSALSYSSSSRLVPVIETSQDLMQQGNLTDSDEEGDDDDHDEDENTNPRISAEKARHIIDFVFGELDDDIIAHPPAAKKARIDTTAESSRYGVDGGNTTTL